MDTNVGISLAAIIIAVLGLSWQYFQVIGGIKERMARLETKMEVFWKVIEKNVAAILKAPTHVDFDALLDKMVAGSLTLEEAYKLQDALNSNPHSDKTKMLASALMLGRVSQIIIDLEYKCKKKR